ncbi:MAG: V-type ATP synthase subunit F [candidate division WOR-3 bacterium]
MPTEISRIAVVGPEDVVMGMGAVGVDVFAVQEGDARSRVEELIRAGYQVIFYTDNLAGALKDVVKRFSQDALPCIVALPFSGLKDEFDPLVRAVARAVGANLLGPDKDRTGRAGGDIPKEERYE